MSFYYSVAIPVFNEIDNLEELISRVATVMSALKKDWELILVDDGSDDGSWEKITSLKPANPFLRGLALDKHHGQTAAMDAGIKAARGEIVITMDADLKNDPADIPLLLKELKTSDAAVGWRKDRNDPFVRRVSSIIANWVRNKLSSEQIHDTGCSLKAFKADILKRIKLFEGMHRFLPTLIKMEGSTVVEVKVGHFPRTRGKSKYNIWNRIFRSFLDLLAIRWMKWRGLKYKVNHEV